MTEDRSFRRFADRPLADLVSLAGRTAVVTGGARGIGAAIVRRFVEAGAAVQAVDHRDIADAQGATPHRIDVADHAAVRAVLFAASDLGGFVTASTILADGGEVYAT